MGIGKHPIFGKALLSDVDFILNCIKSKVRLHGLGVPIPWPGHIP